MAKRISLREFSALTQPLIGLPVSRTHEGYWTTALFHFGNLTKHSLRAGRSFYESDGSVMLEHHWRVEKGNVIWFSSHSCVTKREKGLASLMGKSVRSLSTEGRLPELILELSGDVWVKSFGMAEEHPTWTVFLKEGGWLGSQSGELLLSSEEN